jgi:hypothetical protein
MRKLLISLLAVAALGATASSALADDPAATYIDSYSANSLGRQCDVPYRTGVLGQYGAWGYFVDGCTVMVRCPTGRTCTAEGWGWTQTRDWDDDGVGDRVTNNARLSIRSGFFNTMIWRRDDTCAGPEVCFATGRTTLTGGQKAAVQCNGVRAITVNTATVGCRVRVAW